MTTITRTDNGAKHYARQYAAAGLRVLQVKPNSKRPARDGWPEHATCDEQAAEQMFATGSYGIGVAMGRWRNTVANGTWLLTIDCDCKPGKPDGVAAFAELIEQHGDDIGTPWIQHTPSGGKHYVWQVPFQHGNSTGSLPDGVDVRGDGGQIVAQSADTDTRHWEPGHAPWDHEPGIAPDWLQELLQSPATHHSPDLTGAQVEDLLPEREPNRPYDATAPGEIYNRHADWVQLLNTAGWRCIEQAGVVSHWERPGQPVAGQIGGTLRLNDGNHGLFYVWSTTWAAQIPSNLRAIGKSYQAALTPFALYAVLRHRGDMIAAASELKQQQQQRDDARLDSLAGNPPATDAGTKTANGDAATDDGPAPGHSMRFATLADYTGDLSPRQPTVLPVEGRGCLLYPNSDNSIWAPSGTMKSWLAAFAVLKEIQAGNHVVVIDYEMSQADWKRRLLALGATAEHMRLVHYIAPREQLRVKAKLSTLGYGSDAIETMTQAQRVLVQELQTLIARHTVTLAVIDGFSELMSSNGLNTNDAEDIAKIFAAVHRPLVDITEAATLSVDHVTHQARNSDRKDSYPLGSQHKVARISGAGYALRAVSHLTAYDKGAGVGQVDLFCVKDRHGQVGQHQSVATLWLRPQPNGTVQASLLPYDETKTPTPQNDWQRDRDRVLKSVRDLNDARRKTPSMGPISTAKIATDVDLDPERTRKLLDDLAVHHKVQNTGTANRHDWVPLATDYPDLF